MDLFIVTITVQLLSLFSDKFWYLFLSVRALFHRWFLAPCARRNADVDVFCSVITAPTSSERHADCAMCVCLSVRVCTLVLVCFFISLHSRCTSILHNQAFLHSNGVPCVPTCGA